MRHHCLYVIAALLLLTAPPHNALAQDDPPSISFERVPNGGIQPQVAIDADSTLDLVYFSGDPGHGDLYYVHRSLLTDTAFTAPVRVNSIEGSATALDAVRGAQIAIGGRHRVYVVWNASQAISATQHGQPFYFTRLDDTGGKFEAQRDLISWAGGIDGGGAVAADTKGNVYAVWHGEGEPGGGVFVAKSIDDGKTFGREVEITKARLGQCGCCATKAYIDSSGILCILYRRAQDSIHRDTALLTSVDDGATFENEIVHPWYDDSCPMSAFAIVGGVSTTLGAWETDNQVYFTADLIGRSAPAIAPPGSAQRKYPAVAQSRDGSILLAWTESPQANPCKLGWQLYAKDGVPESDPGLLLGVPHSSFPAVYATPDGRFVILY